MSPRRAIGSEVTMQPAEGNELDREQFPIQDTGELEHVDHANPKLVELHEIRALISDWRERNRRAEAKDCKVSTDRAETVEVDEKNGTDEVDTWVQKWLEQQGLELEGKESAPKKCEAWLKRECCEDHRAVMRIREELIERARKLTGDKRKHPMTHREISTNEKGEVIKIGVPAMFSKEWFELWENKFSGK